MAHEVRKSMGAKKENVERTGAVPAGQVQRRGPGQQREAGVLHEEMDEGGHITTLTSVSFPWPSWAMYRETGNVVYIYIPFQASALLSRKGRKEPC